MSRRVVAAGSAFAALVAGHALAQAAPAWCNMPDAQKLSLSGNDLERLYTETDARNVVMTVVAATCYPDEDARGQAKQIELTRQAWSKKLGMTDADWADAAAWAQAPQYERNNLNLWPTKKRAWSAYTPIDQYGAIKNSTLGDSSATHDQAYMVDAFGAKLTEVGRLAYITECIRDEESTAPVRWAMCAGDVAAFDAKKFETELRGDTDHNGFERMTLRFALYEALPNIAAHAGKVKELKAKDPAYAKMFDIAEQATKDFAKVDPKLLELMGKIDDARVTNSRKASEGCEVVTWDAFKGAVAAIGAKPFAALKGEDNWDFFRGAVGKIVSTPNGYLASLALNQCGVLKDDENYLVRELGENMAFWPGFRGPRNATHTAILTAGLELDDRDARIDYPDLSRPWLHRQTGSSGGGRGVVASIKIKGDKATVEFKKEKVKQTRCTKGHYTNRVIQITSSGSVIYQYVCTKEITETIVVAPSPPLTVNARYVAGLKAGMYVVIVEDVVTVAYPKSSAAAPAVLAGVAVK